MKASSPAPFLAAALIPLALSSCGSTQLVQQAKETTSTKVSELSKFSFSDLLPSKVDVVEVREKDLKEMPLGEERALAYENKRKRSFWNFGGPVDFVMPAFPSGGAEIDGSLLPPKSE